MKLLLFYLALSSSVIVGSLGNIVDILASIEVPEADITTLIPNPTEQFRGYKILNEIDGVIYIGGREILIMYDAAAAKPIRNLTFPAYEDPSEIVTCEGLIGEENSEKICQHYIRLAEYVNDDRLLVCGTNKQTPHCDLVNAVTYKKISNFTAARKTQRSVTQNTTASYYGGYLYVGFSENTQPNPAHISKFTVDLDDLIEIAETDDQNENFVNEPHFVGKPYVKGNYMYFFYRETAVEAVNQGKFVYSRVARICLNDSGFNGNFEIFVKARLNCSLQGDYPFYFNHIQDVIFEEEGGDTIFYAVFTTTPHGPSSSAVCAYKLSDINKVFEESKFKGKESSGKLPGPVDRPAYANKFTECERLNNDERNFLKRNPLMDDLVPNWNQNRDGRGSDGPLFYSTSVNFYSIAVDNSTEGKIFYVGTEHGTILKAYYDSNKYVFFEQQIWVIAGTKNSKKLVQKRKEAVVTYSGTEMDTLENLLQSGQSTGPYPKALKVYIVQTKVQADVLNLGIADNTAAYKAVCYNKDVKTKLVKGNTVLLRDFHKGRSCLIINSKTKVINAPALSNLTKQILEHAQHLVDPPPPQLIALKDVQLPKPGTPTKLLTVSGEIVQDETSRSVASGQQVRNIKIAEDGTVRPVALWNNASTSPAKAGDKITLTHVIVKDDQYLKQLAISTTNQTIITDAKSAVTGLRFDSVNQTLLIVTGEGLFRMNLEACNAYCEEECNKFYHPYCTFAEGSCRAIRSTETTSVNNGNVRDNRVNILSLPHGNTITSCNSRNVELTCVVKSSTLCGSASLIWRLKKDGRYLTLVSCTGGDKCVGETSEVGHIVEFREIVRKPHYKMIHLSVDVHQTKTVGNFSCLYVEEDIEKTVQIQYDESEGCLTENLYQKREKHRKKLETEKTMLTQCSESKTQMVSSADVLFKACSECPGNPEINPDAL